MKLKKENIQNLVKAILFLAIIFMLFLFFTYLFRNTGRASRENILEYYDEEENSLDVVFIGASNVICYWDPMRAWKEYGFASRNYATLSMQGSTYLEALQDALKTQSPEVIVVEPRLYTRNYADRGIDAGVRNFLDSLDYGFSRWRAVYSYCKKMNIPWKEAISLYVDLINYHDNYAALLDPEHWALADNRVDKVKDYDNVFKGYGFRDKQVAFDGPMEVDAEDTENVLDPNALKFYIELIEYCQSHNINLLFMASPMVGYQGELVKLGLLADVAAEYGVPFVNMNERYDEIGLDFSQDFFDVHHTNVLGGDKFTDYFAAYLVENYDLPDHRGEAAYASWDELYEEYIVASDKSREIVREKIAENEAVLAVEEKMKACEDLTEWLDMANNTEISLLIVAKELPEGVPSEESKEILSSIGITDEYFAGTGALKILYNTNVKDFDLSTGKKRGEIGEEGTKYTIAMGDRPKILIKQVNYFDETKEGIHVLAFDNNTEEIFDIIYLKVAADGSLLMER